MAMLRTAQCDICGKTKVEKDYGLGWKSWCIIQGIAAHAPDNGEPLTTENTSMMLCEEHKNKVADFITKLQEE